MSGIVAERITTVANLIAAFEGESNANARYSAFALKADAEGWHGVASLFRAAARSERIHAANHARALNQLHAETHCEIHAVDVKSTLDNLQAALAGEEHEINVMYPGFISEACGSKISVAERTFNWAMEAEKTHARLFREAIQLVKMGTRDSWVTSPCQFYVCPVCGYTSDREEEEHCPVCTLAWHKFEIVK